MGALRDNLVNKNRTDLRSVFPLEFPFSIAVDVSNYCNFKCTFCAAQDPVRSKTIPRNNMKLDTFKGFVDNIESNRGHLKMLRFGGFGEPLLNTSLCEMISYASKRNVTDWIEIVTNGSCLEPELNERLVESGVNRIRISVEALNEAGYAEIAHYKMDYKRFVGNIKDLYYKSRGKCQLYIKTVNAVIRTVEDKKNFYNMYEDMCDQIFIDNVVPLWSDFDEIDERFERSREGEHGQKIEKVDVCSLPLYSCIICSDGDVVACCADWEKKFIAGNIIKEPFYNIWNGEKMRRFWEVQLRKQRKDILPCKKCRLPEYDCPDKVDEVAELLLEKLNYAEDKHEKRK